MTTSIQRKINLKRDLAAQLQEDGFTAAAEKVTQEVLELEHRLMIARGMSV